MPPNEPRAARSDANGLDPEKVAYWYFRLNGFFQFENFVVHPERCGSQRTDADLLGVRFPHRAERLIDDRNDLMADDEHRLSLSGALVDVVIVEVKRNDPCTLNGPWTKPDGKNVHRVLAAIGCFPPDRIADVAADVYRAGIHTSELGLRVRLVAVGRDRSDYLSERYPDVTQLTWSELLEFVWSRFHAFQNQKAQVDQWDEVGRQIKQLAVQSRDQSSFVEAALRRMGVRYGV